MGPAVVQFDLTQAGAIIADMVVAYLDAVPPPLAEEMRDDPDDLENQPNSSDATGLRLYPSIDAGPGAVQPGEHRAPVQPDGQGPGLRLDPGADPGSGRRPGSIRIW